MWCVVVVLIAAAVDVWGMARVLRFVGGVVGVVAVVLGLWDAWWRFTMDDVDRVPYTVLERSGAFELREYPDLVAVRTAAESQREAFGRLFAYIDGANATSEDVAMTAPVASSTAVDVAMTTPVASTPTEDGVEMWFFLPAEYTLESAPTPTDDHVELEVHEHRRVATYRFSWFTTDGRVERAHRRVKHALADRGFEPVGEPELHRYDDPRTPPWQRRNEIVVELA